MKQYGRTKPIFLALTASLAVWSTMLFAAPAVHAWGFTVPAAEVQPQKGVFLFPEAAFQDGQARYFRYTLSPTQRVRFFVVQSVDGVIRAAFDSCDVCFRAKKGYVQQGSDMVCANCGLKFRTDKVNEVSGGCNPGPLRRTVKDGNVVISQQDVLAGLKYFQ